MGDPINVAIIGVGNCASSLVQGVEFYRDAHEGETIPGLMHPVLGGYHIRDIRFTAAIDIDANKVCVMPRTTVTPEVTSSSASSTPGCR